MSLISEENQRIVPSTSSRTPHLSVEETDALWLRVDQGVIRSLSRRRMARVFGASTVGLCLVLGGARMYSPQRFAAHDAGMNESSRELLLATGAPVGPMVGEVRLADGSTVRVDSGRVDVESNGAAEFALFQREGHASYFVTPGGPRRWTVRTPSTRVEVIGTAFEVDVAPRETGRSDTSVRTRVHVEHGIVLVHTPGGDHRLVDGESWEEPVTSVYPTHELQEGPPPSSGPREAKPSASLPSISAGPGPQKALTAPASVEELFQRSDRLRLAGQPASAMAPLAEIVAEHSHDPRAAVAAFSLGRLREQTGDSRGAVRAFHTVPRLPGGAGLAESACVREVESTARYDESTARSTAAACVLRFPQSRSALARWTSETKP